LRLLEFQGKSLFRDYGIPVPRGETCETPDGAANAASRLGGAVVLKAQVPVGGRGKASGISTAATPEEAMTIASKLLGREIRGWRVSSLLVEERLDVESEWDASVTFGRAAATPVVVLSTCGGVDVEQAARGSPGEIHRLNVAPLWGFHPYQARRLCLDAGIPLPLRRATANVLLGLWKLFNEHDCELAEINPLVVTSGGGLVACDAKVNVDGSALFRQPDIASLHMPEPGTHAERRAAELDMSYVALDGTVGLAGNGAGLVMATLDAVHRAGGSAANFLDMGGGTVDETVREAFEVLGLASNVRAVFFNVFGGITRCDVVAQGLLDVSASGTLPWPVVVRLAGTNSESALDMLHGSPYDLASGLDDGARRAVELAAGDAGGFVEPGNHSGTGRINDTQGDGK